jgi:hypothetical protein
MVLGSQIKTALTLITGATVKKSGPEGPPFPLLLSDL